MSSKLLWKKIDVYQKLTQVEGYWHPYEVGSFNGQEVLLSKMKGEFVFHHHDDVDDFFCFKRRV